MRYTKYKCSLYFTLLYMLSFCVCPSICLSICLSHTDDVPKRLNVVGSCKQCRIIAQGLQFADAKHVSEDPMLSPPMGATNRGRYVGSNWRFLTNSLLYPRNGAR